MLRGVWRDICRCARDWTSPRSAGGSRVLLCPDARPTRYAPARGCGGCRQGAEHHRHGSQAGARRRVSAGTAGEVASRGRPRRIGGYLLSDRASTRISRSRVSPIRSAIA
uniref:Uncharacterized protein n=1 Tax=uncultured marine virus TaxID=186617 RepID=A0A0F7L665_9VIRU|nr:hypothetical protein [uncultured marine virus]